MLDLCAIAKQRIDSGFFLYQAEQQKKEEKKKIRKSVKTKNLTESSDEDFAFKIVEFTVFQFFPELISSHN